MKKIKKNRNYLMYIIVTIFIVTISTMSLGFASIETLLPLNGTVGIDPIGKLEITNIRLTNATNASEASNPTYSNLDGEVYLTIPRMNSNGNKVITVMYEVTLTNNSSQNFIYEGISFNSTAIIDNTTYENRATYQIFGINPSDTINVGENKTFTIQITYNHNGRIRNNSTLNANFTINGKNEDLGVLVATNTIKTGDLTGNNVRTPVELDLLNTYNRNINATVSLSNNNFYLVDEYDQPVTNITFIANTEETKNYYLKIKDGVKFSSTEENVSILLYPNELNTINTGNIKILVDQYIQTDFNPPVLGNATLTILNDLNKAVANWQLIEEETSVTKYVIELYKEDNTLFGTYESTVNTYEFSNLEEGTYYYKVYGIDELGNSGVTNMSSATTSNGYAIKSNSTPMKWTFTVTFQTENITVNGNNTVNIGETYTASFTPRNNYTLTNEISVKMDEAELIRNTHFTYENGTVTIPNVTGNLEIGTVATNNGGCLIEGTKVLLANNEYKKIEDIKYDDLLKVINLDTGKITYEYPTWIEKEGSTDTYTKITFDDGTTLNTFSYHGVYSTDFNRFVDISINSEFHIGSTIIKYENNKFKEVKVTNIEKIKKLVNYYHVITTTYYNIISDDVITTDGNIELLNVYGFKEPLVWKEDRTKIMQDNNNILDYDLVKDIMPHYMYLGLRANEVGYILNKYNITDISDLKVQLLNINTDILKPLEMKNNKYFFTVSVDKKKYKVKEYDNFKLPKDKKVKYYLNTVNNKKYKPGDNVKIELNTHFIKIN